VQYLAVMAMLDGKADLSEKVENLILSEVLEHTGFGLLLMLIFDLSLQVSVVSVVHDYAQLALFRFVYFSKANNVRMAEDFKDLSLSEGLLSLFVTQLLNINLLDDRKFTIGLALDEVGCSERASTEGRHLLVGFVLLLFNHSSLLLS
jgi:hypothetical protein